MGRARSVRSGRSGARVPGTAPTGAPAGADVFARLSQTIGNRALGRMLARSPSDAPPIKDRSRIDRLGKMRTVSPVDRCEGYAEIAGTQWVHINPTEVHTSPFYQDGLNLDALEQARDVPATTGWIDARDRFSGGAPPEDIKGIAIVVNSGADRFEDEDYMVAAIRHEMVHVRLMRLTQKHLNDWKRAKSAASFAQYVDKHVAGGDAALVKDRYFGGHMDETVAYLDGFLTAYDYSPLAEPRADDRAWVTHLEGFAKQFETARINGRPLPRDLRGIPERNVAMTQSANFVVAESERLLRDYCKAAGDARRQNLAAWMQHLYATKAMPDAALKLIHQVATKGTRMPALKR